jgi:threonine synthase
MIDLGTLDASDTVVAIETGSGLNMPESVFQNYGRRPKIANSIDELERLAQSLKS